MSPAPGDRALPAWLFTATIFTGSFLLFLIQPMIARMALPRLGGAPAVWNSAMLVYQGLLLAGYAYAHWLTRLRPRVQVLIHLSVCLAAAVSLPIGLSNQDLPADANAFLWVPWLLLSSIGPLFLLVSANAPLLQRWFATSGQADPYPLYAASNLGSFAGLIAYPLLLEPLMPVSDQRLLWSVGYGLLLALLLGCASMIGRADEPTAEFQPAPAAKPSRGLVLKWVWLAFIPSGLMLATTLFITTDLNPMPLLWVLPLGLYLLSFTIAFSSRGAVARLVALAAPFFLVPAAAAMFIGDKLPLMVAAAILLAALFAIATACHLKLYESRPDVRLLTNFYLAVAIGGALGGLFCALVAPLIFDWTYEYPLLLVAAAAVILPGYSPLVSTRWLRAVTARPIVLAAGACALLLAGMLIATTPRNSELVRYGSMAAILIGSLLVGSRALLIATMASAMIVAGALDKLELSGKPGQLIRTYFGTYSLIDQKASRQLLHGTTLHGIQLHTRGWERWQTTYYARDSGVGQALQLAPALFGPAARISVVGLGTGTLACYRRPGQAWTFFELDPAIAKLATTSGRFTFLQRCAPDVGIVIGDARLQLGRFPPASADILVVDAFSSDAVPMHLLTAEAFRVYGRYLQPDGLLLVHISNRHIDLEPVVSAAGWHVRVGQFSPPWDYRQLTASDWMALSRSARTIEALEKGSDEGFWKPSSAAPVRWTDDRASLLPVLK